MEPIVLIEAGISNVDFSSKLIRKIENCPLIGSKAISSCARFEWLERG